MLCRSIIALAASAAFASALGPFPIDIANIAENVASLLKDTPFYSQMSQAVVLLEAGQGLPGQQARDEGIISSLLVALNNQNAPTLATGIAESVASVLENGDGPTELASLVSSAISEMRNPAINTQVASIFSELIEFLIQVKLEIPRSQHDSPTGPTPTSSHTSTNTRTSTSAKPGTSASTPTSKSLSPRSTATSSANSQSSEETDESDSSSHESSSKTNAAQSIKPLFGYMSLGTAAGVAVVASFF